MFSLRVGIEYEYRPESSVPFAAPGPRRCGVRIAVIGAGGVGLVFGNTTDYIGLLAILALVGAGQAIS